jgi:hypothetical protein
MIWNYLVRASHLFDFISEHEDVYEHIIVYVALAAFCVHVGLIFLHHLGLNIPGIGMGYLSSIYTPFSILLFYEVFLLILSVPRSLILSIGKQFEIVALITLWNSLKDFAKLEEVKIDTSFYHSEILGHIGIDLAAALVMFLIIAFFYIIAKKIPEHKTVKHDKFVIKEKVVALILVIFYIALAIYDIFRFFMDAHPTGMPLQFGATSFYQNIFTLMIFANIVGLILSFLYTHSFGSVFLNGAFVISTILILFALSNIGTFTTVGLIVSMLFSLLVLVVFRYLWTNSGEFRKQEEKLDE